VDLHGGVAGPHRRAGRVVLGDRRLLGGLLPLVLHPGGPPDEQAGRVQLGRHVGQHVLNGLEVGDRLSELDPILGVALGRLERGPADADRPGPDADPPLVEDLQGVEEASVYLPDALLVRNLDLFED
jgi:hypothetical protein